MASSKSRSAPYLVLARKYRPASFETLIGQDAMVQTLTNAFRSGRIHHAFILTGVRGVGKTTTARILARAFNFADKAGKHPTLDLETEGEHCRPIIEGRHVDVIEMDAASNTGIDDIREIIDSIQYGPVSAPYKVYVIDEVHMLSKQAFNGLLKTLEEPPPYVKFIFATTEIRKVPVTILSRCQRFDLRRVAPGVMTAYLEKLLQKENIGAEDGALAMIVRAGEGSVRDCLSLLDQAIAHGDGAISAVTVQAMLGLADRARTIDVFEAVMAGRIADALEMTAALYVDGADPHTMISDLAGLTHMVTRLKMVASASSDRALSPLERDRGAKLAERLGVRELTRAWQILIKGADEVAGAGNGLQAAEMVLVRLAYAANLPTPDEVISRLGAADDAPHGTESGAGAGARDGAGMPPPSGPGSPAMAPARQPATPPQSQPVGGAPPGGMPASFADLIILAGQRRDLVLRHALETYLRPISFAQGRIEVALTEGADPSLIATLSARLKNWTGRAWMVTVSNTAAPAPTVRETRDAQNGARDRAARADPLVRAVLETFPGSKIVNVRMRYEPGQPAFEPEIPQAGNGTTKEDRP